MCSHVADLSSHRFDALRQLLGDVIGENRKDIYFIGAVGEIALVGSQYSTMSPETAGPFLYYINSLWRELHPNNNCNKAYKYLWTRKGEFCLFGPFGSVALISQKTKRRQHSLSLQSTKGVFAVILTGNAYFTHAGQCTALAHPSGGVFLPEGEVTVEVEGTTTFVVAYVTLDQSLKAQERSWVVAKEKPLRKLLGKFTHQMTVAKDHVSNLLRIEQNKYWSMNLKKSIHFRFEGLQEGSGRSG